MKKVLSILGTISLLTIISTNVIACKKPNENNKTTEIKFIPQQPPENSDWKHILRIQAPNKEFLKPNNKWYFYIRRYNNEYIIKKIYFNKNFMNNKNTQTHWQHFKNNSNFIWDKNSVYRWDGINEPTLPTINEDTGKIINWNEK